ncbi:MAG: hypothetical protein CENE_01896 [Candidatus Celerinatantimonas neptuna]|nr:MAG: hypothetical protein CENE_01896 [Candidatus Celerinatantimonas neptuna]
MNTLEISGVNAIAIKCNAAIAAEVLQIFDAIEKELRHIDLLVNNAGIMKLAKLSESNDALFEQHIAIHLKGTFNMLKLVAE